MSSGSQQQWYTRSSTLGSWAGGNWNMTFSGVGGAPAADVSHTVLPTTPVTKEKPYLYIDDAGTYSVFVPALEQNTSGTTWPNTAGTSVPLSQFYVAHPGDSAERINSALAQGLNLFFQPRGLHPGPDDQRHPPRHDRLRAGLPDPGAAGAGSTR